MNPGSMVDPSSIVQGPVTNNNANSFYNSFVFSTQPLYVYPPTAPDSPHSLVQSESPCAIPLHSCDPQVFTFSPQETVRTSAQWHEPCSSISPAAQDTVTPTNFSTGFADPGSVTATTPEFLYPRNTNALQWLMSPPVEENDPSVVSYFPFTAPLQPYTNAVSQKLLTPDDFLLPSTSSSHLCAVKAQENNSQNYISLLSICPGVSGQKLDSCIRSKPTAVSFTDRVPLVDPIITDSETAVLSHCAKSCLACPSASGGEDHSVSLLTDDISLTTAPHCSFSDSVSTVSPSSTDSGLESQMSCGPLSTSEHKYEGPDYLAEQIFLLSKGCGSVVEFEQALRDSLPHYACNTMLRLLLGFSLSHRVDIKPFSEQLAETIKSEITPHLLEESKTKICPIGVFWDIENCSVPTGKSAFAIAEKIRRTFFHDHAEAEFMAVCDINKESRQVVQDLNNAQVNVIHVNATAKNAADDKLRQSIRRYAQAHSAPATVILITGDCNFISEVSDLRHRNKYFVVLIHPLQTTNSLIQAANSTVSFEEFVSDLPVVYRVRETTWEAQLLVTNLPLYVDVNVIRGRLKQLSENCGGRVMRITPPTATIKFHTEELARRALKRLNGESVCGLRIIVQWKRSDLSPHSKHFMPRNRPRQVNSADTRLRRTPSGSSTEEQLPNAEISPRCCNMVRVLSRRPHPLEHNNVRKPTPLPSQSNNVSGVQLTISNIDSKLGVKSIQEAVWNMITEYTAVWKLQIRPHNRFTVMCDVTVPDVIAASCVLQHLHRRKIGNKRILVTISQRAGDDVASLRRELTTIFDEQRTEVLHFHKLSSLYCQSYQKKLKFEQLESLNDFLVLDERREGVYVFLLKSLTHSSVSHCQLHYRRERCTSNSFIKIEVGLREFSAKLHALLHSHRGLLYLNGFEQCYHAEFDVFPYPQDMSTGGVYLEHQISYVPGVQIVDGEPKTIVWSQPLSDVASDTTSEASSSSRSKSSNMISFSREVVELLKTFPYCCIAMTEFKAAYQTHFGHSLRFGGFCDVSDMLLALPYVVQVMGSSPGQLITLTHRTQVKRFTHEIIKILKNSPDKAILVAQLPDMYFRTFDRQWSLRDYGVSVLSDLLDDIPDGNICVTGEGDNIVLSLPIRERTSEELERTNHFSKELVEILKSRPRCRMSFTDFVPAYHRHFGRQCKLSNYGFTKLLDLFEALPHIVQVVEGPEKYLQLTEGERLKVLTSQVIGLLRQSDGEIAEVPIDRVQANFSHKYGFALVPLHYDCDNIEELLRKVSHAVKISPNSSGILTVKPAERKPIRLLCAQVLVLMLDVSVDNMEVEQLHQAYRTRYSEDIAPGEYGFLSLDDVLKKATSGFAKVEVRERETMIALKPIYQRAKRIRSILLERGGFMTLGEFNHAYRSQYGEPLDAERHGFRSCEGMLRALSMVLVVKGFGIKKTLTLRNHMQHGPLSSSVASFGDNLSTDGNVNSVTSSDEITKPRPLREIIASAVSPHKAQKSDGALLKQEALKYEESFRPFQAEKCLGAQRHLPATTLSANPSRDRSPRDFAPSAREFPAPRCFGAVGSDPFYVFESSIERYHQYQSLCAELRHDDVTDYVKSQSGQYQQFKEDSYQTPFANYAPFSTSHPERCRGNDVGSRGLEEVARKTGNTLRDLYEQSSGSQSGRRRFSLSVITLPTGTTSISSTPSPEPVPSTDEESKTSSDDSRYQDNSKQASPAPLRLAASFTTPTT